jgi:hypothetical protein
MGTTLKDKLKTLPPKRQEKITIRTNKLIAEEKLRPCTFNGTKPITNG